MSFMKKTAVLVVCAVIGALLISSLSDSSLSYEDRMITAGLKDALGHESHTILRESPELQALFLDYSESRELVIKANLAIEKYKDVARKILLEYGSETEFKQILTDYGETVVPIIQFFIEEEPFSIRSLSPSEQGWRAVQRIRSDGHNFLGQFEFLPDKMKVKWIQTDRFGKALSSFFTSGIRNLETKMALDQEIKTADLFWAGVDGAIVVSSVKALRVVKLARAGATARTVSTGKEISLLDRTKLFSGRIIPKNAFGRVVLKSGAVAGLAYVVIKHPGFLVSLFNELAKLLGLDPYLVQVVCWALLISIVLLPLIPVLRFIIPVLIRCLSLLVSALGHLLKLITRSKPSVVVPEAS